MSKCKCISNVKNKKKFYAIQPISKFENLKYNNL